MVSLRICATERGSISEGVPPPKRSTRTVRPARQAGEQPISSL